MNQTFIIICADESKNAGERDYTFALMAELRALKEQGQNVTTHIFKIPTDDAVAETKNSTTVDPKNFRPEQNSDYKKIPPLPLNMAEHLGIDVSACTILGAGQSTFDSLLKVQAQLENHDIDADVGYITHVVNEKQMQEMNERNITLFTPVTREDLRKQYDYLIDDIYLETLPSVPHTNTLKSAQENFENAQWVTNQPGFIHSQSIATVNQWIKKDKPFVIAVINAGYEIKDKNGTKTWIPYTCREAYAQGHSLGKYLGKGTNLYAAQGGPRNAHDKTTDGQHPTIEYVRGFMEAQGWVNTQAAIEAYDDKFNLWNPIKASYIFAQHPLCKAFISNAEGYGTMDGAVLAIDNTEKLLGCFPFDALYQDPTGGRQKNIDAYNQKGIALLSAGDDGQLVIKHHPHEQKTPITVEKNAASFVFDYYGLSSPLPQDPQNKSKQHLTI